MLQELPYGTWYILIFPRVSQYVPWMELELHRDTIQLKGRDWIGKCKISCLHKLTWLAVHIHGFTVTQVFTYTAADIKMYKTCCDTTLKNSCTLGNSMNVSFCSSQSSFLISEFMKERYTMVQKCELWQFFAYRLIWKGIWRSKLWLVK